MKAQDDTLQRLESLHFYFFICFLSQSSSSLSLPKSPCMSIFRVCITSMFTLFMFSYYIRAYFYLGVFLTLCRCSCIAVWLQQVSSPLKIFSVYSRNKMSNIYFCYPLVMTNSLRLNMAQSKVRERFFPFNVRWSSVMKSHYSSTIQNPHHHSVRRCSHHQPGYLVDNPT